MPVSNETRECQAYCTGRKAHTSNDETSRALLVLNSLDSDVHLLGAGEDVGLDEGGQTELLEGIVGIGDELTEENIPVHLSILCNVSLRRHKLTYASTS